MANILPPGFGHLWRREVELMSWTAIGVVSGRVFSFAAGGWPKVALDLVAAVRKQVARQGVIRDNTHGRNMI